MEALFSNKKKNLFVLICAVLYFVLTVITIIETGFYLTLQGIQSLLLTMASLILVFAICIVNKDFKFKKIVFSAPFALFTAAYLVSSVSSAITILFYLDEPLVAAMFSLNFIVLFAHILMLISACSNFKKIKFLKIGALTFIISTILLLILEFINVGGFEYIASLPEGVMAVSCYSAVKTTVIIMFYFSLFLLTITKDKKQA